MMIGSGHLLFTAGENTPPDAEEVRKVVTTILAGVARDEGPGG
jgi:hypothetical protein